MKNLSAKEVGGLGEMIFCTEALRRGFIVSKPLIDTRKYDIILDNRQGRLHRVQIKSSQKPGAMDGHYKFNMGSGTSKRVIYTPDDIDFIVCIGIDKHYFFIIPIADITSYGSIRIYPDKPNTKNYKYRGAWDSFFWESDPLSESTLNNFTETS